MQVGEVGGFDNCFRRAPMFHVLVGCRKLGTAGGSLNFVCAHARHAAVFVHRRDGNMWIAEYDPSETQGGGGAEWRQMNQNDFRTWSAFGTLFVDCGETQQNADSVVKPLLPHFTKHNYRAGPMDPHNCQTFSIAVTDALEVECGWNILLDFLMENAPSFGNQY